MSTDKRDIRAHYEHLVREATREITDPTTYRVGDPITLPGVITQIDGTYPAGPLYCVAVAEAAIWVLAADLTPPTPHAPPGWCWLPQRRTALNLAHVSRVEFGARRALVYCDAADVAGFSDPPLIALVSLELHGADVAALRTVLGLPAEEDTDA